MQPPTYLAAASPPPPPTPYIALSAPQAQLSRRLHSCQQNDLSGGTAGHTQSTVMSVPVLARHQEARHRSGPGARSSISIPSRCESVTSFTDLVCVIRGTAASVVMSRCKRMCCTAVRFAMRRSGCWNSACGVQPVPCSVSRHLADDFCLGHCGSCSDLPRSALCANCSTAVPSVTRLLSCPVILSRVRHTEQQRHSPAVCMRSSKWLQHVSAVDTSIEHLQRNCRCMECM